MKWMLLFLTPLLLVASAQEDLCHLFGIPESGTEMFDAVRSNWIQQGKERWLFDQRYEHLRETVWPLFRELGMVDEIKPSKNHYDTVVVMGSLLSTFQRRLDYLAQTGVTFDQIVFLSGDRPLLDSEKAKLPHLETEGEMVRFVYECSCIPKNIPVQWIIAPMRGARRPNTYDTIKIWLEQMPIALDCLIVSSQPYVHYQGAILTRYLPFAFEMTGPAVVGSPTVALMLDTLGREIFYKQGDIEWLQQ